jgi:hypothetical protein
VELVKPLRERLSEPVILSLLTAVRNADSLASLDADGLAAAAAILQDDAGRGPSFILVFTDGYGSCGLRLTSTLAALARVGTTVVAINVGGESDMKANGLAHCYAHWCGYVTARVCAYVGVEGTDGWGEEQTDCWLCGKARVCCKLVLVMAAP